MLFPDDPIAPEAAGQRRIKAELILQAHETMNLTAAAVGDQDLAFGVSYLQQLAEKYGTPYVCANLVSTKDGHSAFPARKVVEIEGIQVGLFGVIRTQDYMGRDLNLGPAWKITDPIEAAKAQVKALKAEGADYIIALGHLGLDQHSQLMEKVPEVNLVVGGHGSARTYQPVPAGNGFIVHAGYRGKHLGLLKIQLVGDPKKAITKLVDATGSWQAQERIDLYEDLKSNLEKKLETVTELSEKDALSQRIDYFKEQIAEEEGKLISEDSSSVFNDLVPLGADIADEPRVSRQVNKALEEIGKLPIPAQALGKPTPEPTPLKGSLVGATVCQACHPKEYGDWKQTQHAHAYETLVKEKRQYDYDCVGCHTTGYKAEGGFRDPFTVGQLTDVQCEACHGEGRKHAANPKRNKLDTKVNEELCRGCHSMEQTGDRFDFSKYVPQVDHDPSTKSQESAER